MQALIDGGVIGGGVGQTIVKFTGADFIAGGKAKIETGVGEIVLVLHEQPPSSPPSSSL